MDRFHALLATNLKERVELHQKLEEQKNDPSNNVQELGIFQQKSKARCNARCLEGATMKQAEIAQGQFEEINSKVDSIISESQGLIKQFKGERSLKRQLNQLLAKPMPNKGNAIGIDNLEEKEAQTYNENIEEKRNVELLFSRERPKSEIYSKFARPSTGKHSLYKKRQAENIRKKYISPEIDWRKLQTLHKYDCPGEDEILPSEDAISKFETVEPEGSRKFGQRQLVPKHRKAKSTVFDGSTNHTSMRPPSAKMDKKQHCSARAAKELPNFQNTQMNKNMKQLQKMFIRNNFEIMKLKNDQLKKQQTCSLYTSEKFEFCQSEYTGHKTPDIDIGLGSVMIETNIHSRQYSTNGDLQNEI